MRSLLYTIPLILLLSGHTPERRLDSPNVILIIADQMRGDALGILGHPDVRTPNLDRMAIEGVLFENYFVNNPVCVPSRMSLHSGRYPHQHGSISNAESIRLASTKNTFLGHFEEKGYRLGWFGKDNHAYSREVLRNTLEASSSRRREPFRAYSAHTPPHWYADTPWPLEALYPAKTTDDALDFISEDDERPFFAVLSLFDPHPPYFAPAEYVAHYTPGELTLPEFVDPVQLSPRLADYQRSLLFDQLGEPDLRATMAHYYAAIEWGIDAQIGRILEKLGQLGIEDDTIVIFTSDHGDFMGEFGMVRKGMFLYDALLHVPLIWYAPGRLAEDHRTTVLAQGVDFLPSLIDLIGDPVPEKLSGRSLKPFLLGAEENEEDPAVFAMAGYSDLPADYFTDPETPFFSPVSEDANPFHSRVFDLLTPPRNRTAMIRTAQWKLIVSDTQPAELYRLAGNHSEAVNLADSSAFQIVLSALRDRLDAELDR